MREFNTTIIRETERQICTHKLVKREAVCVCIWVVSRRYIKIQREKARR